MPGMRRREFVSLFGGAAIACPFAARAQHGERVPRIGVLVTAPAMVEVKRMASFRQGLGESGYIEGQNVLIEYLHADNQYERLPALAADLVRRQVNVIVTPNSESAAMAARTVTTTKPIIFSVTEDPVKIGLVASLARPDDNVTGVYFFSSELGPKRLGLLSEIVPGANRFAVLANPSNPISKLGLQQIGAAARAIGLELRVSQCRRQSPNQSGVQRTRSRTSGWTYVRQRSAFHQPPDTGRHIGSALFHSGDLHELATIPKWGD